MEPWTAFVVGLVGSLHCVGMCGPIALALPQGFGSRMGILGSRLLYNFGRVITYALLGAVLGLIGFGASLAGWQRGLSLGLGIMLILLAVLQIGWLRRFLPRTGFTPFENLLKKAFGRLMRRGSFSALFGIGLLNGFLPCGLVYLALAGAVSTGSPELGALYMVLFGLGTVPAMLTTALLGSVIGTSFRRRVRPVLLAFTLAFGVLFILRGLNLGVPYLSPKIDVEQGEAVECCH
jgi:sulfite exporter TauE/SafE